MTTWKHWLDPVLIKVDGEEHLVPLSNCGVKTVTALFELLSQKFEPPLNIRALQGHLQARGLRMWASYLNVDLSCLASIGVIELVWDGRQKLIKPLFSEARIVSTENNKFFVEVTLKHG